MTYIYIQSITKFNNNYISHRIFYPYGITHINRIIKYRKNIGSIITLNS